MFIYLVFLYKINARILASSFSLYAKTWFAYTALVHLCSASTLHSLVSSYGSFNLMITLMVQLDNLDDESFLHSLSYNCHFMWSPLAVRYLHSLSPLFSFSSIRPFSFSGTWRSFPMLVCCEHWTTPMIFILLIRIQSKYPSDIVPISASLYLVASFLRKAVSKLREFFLNQLNAAS